MAMKTSSPWWVSALLFVGLVAIFAGERAFAHTGLASSLTHVGLAMVAGSIGLRIFVMTKATARQRRVEFTSLLCSMGVVAALLGYYFTTTSGMKLFDIASESAINRWQTSMLVLWVIIMLMSLVPLVMIEISLGASERGGFKSSSNASVDVFRVREMASSGLSIALAACFLLVTCNIADQRNIRHDVSYFKTSSPGSATVNMVKSMTEPLQVLLFFPENNEVELEVKAYFESLAASTGNVELLIKDRLIDSDQAKQYKIQQDGSIVLARSDRHETFRIKTKIRTKGKRGYRRNADLREFDGKVQKALMKVMRDTRVAYFMVGHGELNDPDSAGKRATGNPLTKATQIKTELRKLNYKAENYDGFGKPVPDDCDLLFILAPRTALLEEDLQAIDDYLAQGGAAIISLDPDAEMRLGLLSKRLGVVFNDASLADDKEFLRRTRTRADHALLLTNQFSSHGSVTTLSQGVAEAGILFARPGSLEDFPLADDSSTKKTHVIKAMSTAFRDLPDPATGHPNLVFDEGSETRARYNIVAAIEDPSAKPANLKEGAKHNGMRVMVFADAEIFSDALMGSIPPVRNMIVDAIKWSGGEESFAGETKTEKDKRIEHTKSQDAAWFYLTMVGAPLLVLGFGLFFVAFRRRRSGRRNS